MRKKVLLAAAAGCVVAMPLRAEDVGTVFTLGEVSASATQTDTTTLGGSVVTQDDIRMFNRNTLDQAIELVPGVTVSEVGPRNETDIWIRGFDRWRVPLSIDGIPVYLPADNRIDFSRFATSDISEIQVSKGFTSVIAGPGAMGGAINLVSRQVTRPFEGDMRVGTSFDGNGAFNGLVSDAFAGSRQQNWYVQAAASEHYQNHFALSDDFPVGTLENGGNRDHSYSQDSKLNVKAGFVPNATDEYSINFIDQIGQKDNPLYDGIVPTSLLKSVRYWTWPAWDKQSVYYLSKTAIDDQGSYVKVRLYYDRFFNQLDSYDNARFTTQTKPFAFNSTYDDWAGGGNVEVSKNLFDGMDTVKAAAFFRYDTHNDQESTNAKPFVWYDQPWLHDKEDTTSIALENTVHPVKPWDITVGISYDYLHMIGAQDFDTFTPTPSKPPYGFVVNYPVSDKHALNPEFATVYHYDETGSVHASISEKSRFPTLFEQFSSRFGSFTGNPYLRPERTVNLETGVADTIDHIHVGANLFYSRVKDAIEGVGVIFPSPIGATTQEQNIGKEIHKGFELEASSQIAPMLEIGGNYSYLLRDIQSNVQIATDVPNHKLFLYANWKPLTGLSIVPSVEYQSKRWLQNGLVTTQYYRGGDFVTAYLKVAYQLRDDLQVEAGVTNLFDANYRIEDGYNAPGRGYFTNIRFSF